MSFALLHDQCVSPFQPGQLCHPGFTGRALGAVFGGVFHNLAFLCRLRDWPGPRAEPEQGGHVDSWQLLHSPESSLPTQSWEGASPMCLAKDQGCDCPCLFQETPRLSFVSVTSSLDLSCSQNEMLILWGDSLGPNICSVWFLACKGDTGMETVSGTGRIWLQGETRISLQSHFQCLLGRRETEA